MLARDLFGKSRRDSESRKWWFETAFLGLEVLACWLQTFMSHALEELAEALTVEEFARRTGRSVAEVVAFCVDPQPAGGRRRTFVPRLDHFAALRPVDLATEAGREAFGERVLAVLEHVRMAISSQEILRFSGGTLDAVETTLRALEAARLVRRGKAASPNPLWQSRRR